MGLSQCDERTQTGGVLETDGWGQHVHRNRRKLTVRCRKLRLINA